MNQATTPTTTAPAVSQRLHAPFQASANVRTRIKICGLTREEDVDAAVAAGADAVGFVLYAPSPRSVTPSGPRSWHGACRRLSCPCCCS